MRNWFSEKLFTKNLKKKRSKIKNFNMGKETYKLNKKNYRLTMLGVMFNAIPPLLTIIQIFFMPYDYDNNKHVVNNYFNIEIVQNIKTEEYYYIINGNEVKEVKIEQVTK